MKRVIIISLLLVFFGLKPTITNCQSIETPKPPTTEKAAEGETKLMMMRLKVDRAKYLDLYPIIFDYRKSMDSLHLITKEPTEKKTFYDSISHRRDSRLKKVLTSDQYNIFMSTEKVNK